MTKSTNSRKAYIVTIHEAILHGERLLKKSGIPDSRWNSERVLMLALNRSRSSIYSDLSHQLTEEELSAFERLLGKRGAHYPLAYLEHTQEFYGYPFFVNDSVLIPRPETEEIIRCVLQLTFGHRPLILDLGSGSGNIPATLARKLPVSTIVALEKSADALQVLRRNAEGHIFIVQADFYFIPFGSAVFDCITANLPYVEISEFDQLPAETKWEPRNALVTPSLTETYGAVMKQSVRLLKPGGYLLLEFGFGQVERLQSVAESVSQLKLFEIRNDQQGIPRVLVLQKKM